MKRTLRLSSQAEPTQDTVAAENSTAAANQMVGGNYLPERWRKWASPTQKASYRKPKKNLPIKALNLNKMVGRMGDEIRRENTDRGP